MPSRRQGRQSPAEEEGFISAFFRWVTCTGDAQEDDSCTVVSSKEPMTPFTPTPPLGAGGGNFDRCLLQPASASCRSMKPAREFQVAGDHGIASCLSLNHRHLLEDGRFINNSATVDGSKTQALQEWLRVAWERQQQLRATESFGKVAVHSWSQVVDTFALGTQFHDAESKDSDSEYLFEMFDPVEQSALDSCCSKPRVRRLLPMDELEAYRISALGMSDSNESERIFFQREVAYCLEEDELPLFDLLDCDTSGSGTIEYII